MFRRGFLFAAALCLVGGSLRPAFAESVYRDAGEFDSFTLSYTTTPGLFTLKIEGALLTEVNDDAVHLPPNSYGVDAKFNDPLEIWAASASNVPGTGYSFTLVPAVYDKWFDPDVQNAHLQFQLEAGEVKDATPGVMRIWGSILAAPQPNLTALDAGDAEHDYNFSSLVGGRIEFTLYSNDFMPFLRQGANNPTVSGYGTFVQSIPEPTSVALLGIGLSGLIAFRRRFVGRKTV